MIDVLTTAHKLHVLTEDVPKIMGAYGIAPIGGGYGSLVVEQVKVLEQFIKDVEKMPKGAQKELIEALQAYIKARMSKVLRETPLSIDDVWMDMEWLKHM